MKIGNVKVNGKAVLLAAAAGTFLLIGGCRAAKEGIDYIADGAKGIWNNITNSVSEEDQLKIDKMMEAIEGVKDQFNGQTLQSVKEHAGNKVNTDELKTSKEELLAVMIYVNPEIQKWMGSLNEEDKKELFEGYRLDADTISDYVQNMQRKLWAIYMYGTAPTKLNELMLNPMDQSYYTNFENAFLSYNADFFRGNNPALTTINQTMKDGIAKAENVSPAVASFTLDPSLQVYDVAFRNNASRVTSYVDNGKDVNDLMTGRARAAMYALLENTVLDIDCATPVKENPNTGALTEEEWEEYQALHMTR